MMRGAWWSDEEVEKLRLWWDSGMQAKEISRRLGTHTLKGVSKKVRKLGLEPHERHKKKPVPLPKPKPPALDLIELPRRPGEPPPLRPPVTLLNVKRGQCRWPVGLTAGEMRVCGHPVYGASSWCPTHRARSVVAPR